MSNRQTQREEFLRDIAPTREMIAKWPAWKRNALGTVPSAPNFPPVTAPESARRAAERQRSKPPSPRQTIRRMVSSLKSRSASAIKVHTIPPPPAWSGRYDRASMPRRITWIQGVLLHGRVGWFIWRGWVKSRFGSYWICYPTHNPGSHFHPHERVPVWVHESSVLHLRHARRRRSEAHP